jgi:hypothetical protein
MTSSSKTLTVVFLCLMILWVVGYGKHLRAIDKEGMKNASLCKNEDSDWVNTPNGFYRASNGKCIAGTPPTPSTTETQTCVTPCTLHRGLNQNVTWELGAPMKIRIKEDNGVLHQWVLYPGATKGVQNISAKDFPPGWIDLDSPAGKIPVEIVNK